MTLPLNPPTFKFKSKLFTFSHLLEVVVIWRRKSAGTDPDTPPLHITTASQINDNFTFAAHCNTYSRGGNWELCWEEMGGGGGESMKWWWCGDGSLHYLQKRFLRAFRGGQWEELSFWLLLYNFAFCSCFLHQEVAWILHSAFADFWKIRRAMKKLAGSGNIGALQNRQAWKIFAPYIEHKCGRSWKNLRILKFWCLTKI